VLGLGGEAVAESKETQPWDAVFDRVRVKRSPDEFCTGKVSNADLDCAEVDLSVKLPESYRAFAIRFGLPGELMEYLRFDPLLSRKRTGSSVLSMTRWLREDVSREVGADAYCALDRLRQLVVFGDDGGGGWFVFDPTQTTSIDPLEYRIYWVPKHHGPIEARADTFAELVQWVDGYARERDERMAGELEDIEERRDARIRWTPYDIRKKKPPAQRDVLLWLAWNNNTARDLALSIRDRGQADAFPILADALEEAGCANADLLDSCRTGDPDIDGRWVLQVLLGKK
jgi:hypothetical protein